MTRAEQELQGLKDSLRGVCIVPPGNVFEAFDLGYIAGFKRRGELEREIKTTTKSRILQEMTIQELGK